MNKKPEITKFNGREEGKDEFILDKKTVSFYI